MNREKLTQLFDRYEDECWFAAVIVATCLLVACLSGCATAPQYSPVPGPSPYGALDTNFNAVARP